MRSRPSFRSFAVLALVHWGIQIGSESIAVEPHPRLSLKARACAFSPDGKTFASGSADTTLLLWDLPSGKNTATLKKHSGEVWTVAFSPDGTTLASGSDDRLIQLWDVATGENTATLEGHSQRIQRVVFSPDGKTLLSSCIDNSAKLWDVASCKNTMTLEGYHFGVFSPNGKTVLTGDFSSIALTDLDVQSIRRLELPIDIRSERMTSAVFSPDGNTIAVISGRFGATLRLFDATTCKPVGHFQYVRGTTNVAFSPNGKFLALGGNGGPLLHDISTGKMAHRYDLLDAYVECVAFSPDGTILAGGGNSRDFDVRLWNVATGKSFAAFTIKADPQHLKFAYEVSFSPDGNTLAAKGYDEMITVWDVPVANLEEKE